MGILQLNSLQFPPLFRKDHDHGIHKNAEISKTKRRLCNSRLRISAVGTVPDIQQVAVPSEEPPSVDFAFVSSRLLPDGTPDVHIRSSKGGRKLRNIMREGHIDLYGPYDKPLLNCAGSGTCGTCIVEVVSGKELLSPRTDKEKEILKKKPKTWRLACQTVVGNGDSRGEVIIQTLPEWKAHDWH
ncbi:hypothetical protein AMTRI_Chr05g66980 [Amborella trichopoda]